MSRELINLPLTIRRDIAAEVCSALFTAEIEPGDPLADCLIMNEWSAFTSLSRNTRWRQDIYSSISFSKLTYIAFDMYLRMCLQVQRHMTTPSRGNIDE